MGAGADERAEDGMSWSHGIAEWLEGETAFISITFSWMLPMAYQRAVWFKSQGYRVRAGGPGIFTRPGYLAEVAEIGGEVDALVHHNPQATMASRGCPVGCYFCIVPKIEGKNFTLLPDFTPRPILVDNNLSGLPIEYQDYIIEKYQKFNVPLLDANSGFEPHSFDDETYRRWKMINRGAWRFAYDEMGETEEVKRMFGILAHEPGSKKRVYILIGNEPIESCLERIHRVIEWGGEPHVQPMIALNALIKKPMVRYDWTEHQLKAVSRWANKWIWRTVPLEDYKYWRNAPGSASR